jgi:hypothetical protein
MYLDQAQGLGARKRRKTSEKVKKKSKHGRAQVCIGHAYK